MPLIIRKRFGLGRGQHLNVSKSGVSVSQRLGRVSINSRGGITVRILPGVTWRIGGRK
jgi:hypothetical protein